MPFSSAHADIKESSKQNKSKIDKNWQLLQVSFPFSKNAIVDKSAYKIENQFLANNFVPQWTSGKTRIKQLPINIIILLPLIVGHSSSESPAQ